ncbi:MMPL family transporter [Brenneria goodwinii]|uniref:MMPL family transporter n=1 Tax=Brenneria goodwinii TaxID=1109412 RepID=UPI000EF19763|nr:MMPL family transporter [Brenneria goodwinii]MCG8157370.1 MMPL family transporter [Brenneria goodwinii]MCG8163189.1 MMPL family transporter [Brenneria goodwinii]MCG8165184.1 MMPL family transporter [Brenneria goodwinii]MCG8170848.1 MMPL family transporter [Brenneria goodwinii]MCG8175951.1 MMPL family transporter [Brenneria goodwinii]
MTNNSASFSKRVGRAAFCWGICCVALIVALLLLLPKAQINSSVLALLPKQSMGEIPPELQQGFMQRLDRQMVWLVTPGEQADPAVADSWLRQLQALPELQNVKGPIDSEQQRLWGKFAFEHRNGLVDATTRARLKNGGAAQADWVLAQLYSAFAGVSGQELNHDPLMLVRGSQLSLQQNASQLGLSQGWLTAKDAQGRSWYFLHGELSGASFDMEHNQRLVDKLNGLEASLKAQFPESQVLTRGTVLFSNYASQQAKHDVSTLGVATITGVLLLIFSVFRSPRPLLLCALSVGIGALAGTVFTLLLFGELHLMTLVMSISIVGISADYTLYYLTERMVHGGKVSAFESLRKVLPALLLALGTTTIAYLIMVLAPFPGLQQLAVFAAAGLTASCLTVVCWYPFLVSGLPVRPVPAMVLMGRWLAGWRRNHWIRRGVPLALLVISVVGLLRLEVNDDISQLQTLPETLMRQERQITELTGQSADQTWFVVYGDSAEQTLQRLEQLAPKLNEARQNSWLKTYRLLPLSSLRQQQHDLQLIASASLAVMARLNDSGVEVDPPDMQPMPVTPETWLNSPISEGWRLLWLTLPDGRSGALVPVSGVTRSAELAQLAQTVPGVRWIDRKSTFDELFGFYRVMLGWLLAIALTVIALSYVIRMGLRRGLLSMVPSVLSLGAGLAALPLSGHSLNVFSSLALVLVLGIGINYTLFFSNPRGTPMTSLLAVTLAMCTTLLTLGMLVFSSTQAIGSFGIVLCSGIFTAFLLAPLALPDSKGKRK